MCLVCNSYKAIVNNLQAMAYEAIKKLIIPRNLSKILESNLLQ